MSATDLLCLNRIIKPQIPLEEFLKFTADLGIKYVEVRNDFTDVRRCGRFSAYLRDVSNPKRLLLFSFLKELAVMPTNECSKR
jgi:predicted xylose isomerase-like sugar epimerase